MKLQITIAELAELVGGQLQLASMPPLGGHHEPAGRVVARLSQVQPGDVFVAAEDVDCAVEEAYARGASGVVVERTPLVPWAGRYAIRVADAELAYQTIQAFARQSTLCSSRGEATSCGATRVASPLADLNTWRGDIPFPTS